MTYKALGRSIANYDVPVWSTNASESNIYKIQGAQNEALRIITGSHKMSSTDHLHSETDMLQVEDHLNLLSAQYRVQYLDTTHPLDTSLTLLRFSSLTLLEKECYNEEVQPYRKIDYKLMIYICPSWRQPDAWGAVANSNPTF